RGENTGGRRRAERRLEAIAHRFSRLFHPVEKAVSETQQSLRAAGAHVAGCADAALEQPGFVIEAVRIDVAVRPAQPQREEPALAGMHRAGEDGSLLFGERAAVPREEELARQ